MIYIFALYRNFVHQFFNFLLDNQLIFDIIPKQSHKQPIISIKIPKEISHIPSIFAVTDHKNLQPLYLVFNIYENYISIGIWLLINCHSNILQNQQSKAMAEEVIDFGNFNKKILLNPAVVLQMLDIFYRNNSKVQATLLGKVYSNAIQILQIVPVGVNFQEKFKKLDFAEHSRSLENVKAVYPNYQIIGVAITDLEPEQLPYLHTMYINKETYFKAQGILTQPIIVSIGTKITEASDNFNIEAFTFNQSYLFCKNLMNLISFEKLQVTISLGDSDIQSMTPLFESVNDQQKFFPSENVDQLLPKLVENLQKLKLKCQLPENQELRVRLRRIIDKLKVEENYNIDELAYLLDYASLLRAVSSKVAQLQEENKV